jgi:hypothetical protein
MKAFFLSFRKHEIHRGGARRRAGQELEAILLFSLLFLKLFCFLHLLQTNKKSNGKLKQTPPKPNYHMEAPPVRGSSFLPLSSSVQKRRRAKGGLVVRLLPSFSSTFFIIIILVLFSPCFRHLVSLSPRTRSRCSFFHPKSPTKPRKETKQKVALLSGSCPRMPLLYSEIPSAWDSFLLISL